MLILNIEKFLDFILKIIEEELIISSMHQNYIFIDRENLKHSIMIALDGNDKIQELPEIIKERYLQ